MLNLRETLLTVADTYAAQVRTRGGRSLARVSTIVANQGSFFERLRAGKTCTLTNYEKLMMWFADAANWPGGYIPPDAALLVPKAVPAEAE